MDGSWLRAEAASSVSRPPSVDGEIIRGGHHRLPAHAE
jgi:hypothetical protein